MTRPSSSRRTGPADGTNSSEPSRSHVAPAGAGASTTSVTAPVLRFSSFSRPLAKNDSTFPVCFHAGRRAPSVPAIGSASAASSRRRHELRRAGGYLIGCATAKLRRNEHDLALIGRDRSVERFVADAELRARRAVERQTNGGRRGRWLLREDVGPLEQERDGKLPRRRAIWRGQFPTTSLRALSTT